MPHEDDRPAPTPEHDPPDDPVSLCLARARRAAHRARVAADTAEETRLHLAVATTRRAARPDAIDAADEALLRRRLTISPTRPPLPDAEERSPEL
jgi:hypothetical protein